MTSNDGLTFDVVVVKPGFDDVRLGPASEHRAGTWMSHLEMGLHSTQHPEGTTFAIEVHRPDLPHTDPVGIPTDAAGLAEAIAATPAGNYGDYYPDLYTVLSMHHGDSTAGPLWTAACSYADETAERDELVASLPGRVANVEAALDALRIHTGAVTSTPCHLAPGT